MSAMTQHHRIVPHLWFDREAKEAAAFYTAAFPDSAITMSTTLHNTPGGDTDVVSFELAGHAFQAISAGPHVKINPAISFMVNFDPSHFGLARKHLDDLWATLAEGGTVLMPLDEYPFSERYGWVQDKYGVSWQLILSDPTGDDRPMIVPSLLFSGAVCGQAEAAMEHYQRIFQHTRLGLVARYGKDHPPNQPGTLMYADFMLENQWFAVMDSAQQHEFVFNEGVSLQVLCDTQEEVDHYWDQLSAVPGAEQCGWLKDRFGISWQVVPANLDTMLREGSDAQKARVTEAFLAMRKFDLVALEQAYQDAK